VQSPPQPPVPSARSCTADAWRRRRTRRAVRAVSDPLAPSMRSIPAISSSARGHAGTSTPFPLHSGRDQPSASTGEHRQAQPAWGRISPACNDSLDCLLLKFSPNPTWDLEIPARSPAPQAGALTPYPDLPGGRNRPTRATILHAE